MAAYREFARFYDAINGDPVEDEPDDTETHRALPSQADSVLETRLRTGAISPGSGRDLP